MSCTYLGAAHQALLLVLQRARHLGRHALLVREVGVKYGGLLGSARLLLVVGLDAGLLMVAPAVAAHRLLSVGGSAVGLCGCEGTH